MIFNQAVDIEVDIKNRISNYLKDKPSYNIKELTSLLNIYLNELAIIHEIKNYKTTIIDNNSFILLFYKNDIQYKLEISLIIELRNNKIKKIKSHLKEFLFFQ